MTDKLTQDEIIAAVRTASRDVFATMLNLPLESGAAHEETDEPESVDGVISMVGIGGSWTGTGRIWCAPKFACRMAEALLMAPYESVNDDVLDAMAEIGNMIIGNVKNIVEEKLGPLGLSLPTVIYGRNYRTRSAGVPSWTVIPFQSGGDQMEVSFCLIRSRSTPQPSRVETPQLPAVA